MEPEILGLDGLLVFPTATKGRATSYARRFQGGRMSVLLLGREAWVWSSCSP